MEENAILERCFLGRRSPIDPSRPQRANVSSGCPQSSTQFRLGANPQLSGAGKPIDLVSTAIRLGTSFIGGSFSSDKVQLKPLTKAAFQHKGAAIHRRSLALRHIQRPRRLDRELQLRARTQYCPQHARHHRGT
jgi:hypothetical protein